MFSLYRCLLYLYPAAYRAEYGDEMSCVFHEVRSERKEGGIMRIGMFLVRELSGLLSGALREHLRALTDFDSGLILSSRRLIMRSEFRFPKFTPVLMAVVLAGIVLAIGKATAIRASLSDGNPRLPPIQPEHFAFLPAMAVIFFSAYALAVIGWAVLFALRRSGAHRLAEMPDTAPRKTILFRD